MLELNLISGRLWMLRGKRKLLHLFRIFNICCFVFTIAAIMVSALLFDDTRLKQERAAERKSQIRNEKSRHNVDSLEKRWMQYVSSLALVDRSLSHVRWAPCFQSLARMVPAGVCIEKVSVTKSDDGWVLALDVVAVSDTKKAFDRVDGLVKDMQKSPLFGKGVKLESHEQRESDGKELESFKINAPVRPL